jgi:hypothetical protein
MGSALDTPDRSPAVFTKRLVRSDGSQVRYLEAGHGAPVIVLARGDDPSSLPLSNLLADHFHVFVFDISHLGDYGGLDGWVLMCYLSLHDDPQGIDGDLPNE